MLTALRIMSGIALAAVAAGFVQLMFATAHLPEPLDDLAASLSMLPLIATHLFVFLVIFGLPFAVAGELLGKTKAGYYAAAGLSVALAGLLVLIAGEPATETLANPLGVLAFTVSGLVGGVAYWLAACPDPQVSGSEEDA